MNLSLSAWTVDNQLQRTDDMSMTEYWRINNYAIVIVRLLEEEGLGVLETGSVEPRFFWRNKERLFLVAEYRGYEYEIRLTIAPRGCVGTFWLKNASKI